ncbi:MAG: cytochrome C biogenesis protein CycH [Ignavibacteriae bacterium]|nr:cytochrome C biogenesis protein CycH [Ignavibacteriota bacterium]NOG98872.1 cytochrome C biogenesis protein CycH [Ignavibacteriota bacterium]
MTKVKTQNSKGEIVLYKAADGNVQLDVKMEDETVWLNQVQMAKLFNQTKQTLSLHINNIYKEKELAKHSTVRKYLTVQKEGNREVKRGINFYNLDVIISVGYRVKSKRGTQFRIWANKILKDYLIQGYALYEKRLKEQTEKIKDIEKTLLLFSKAAEKYQLEKDEFTGILKVVTDYTHALDLLDAYDYQKVRIRKTTKKQKFKITYSSALEIIEKLKEKFGSSDLFGKEKDQSFKGSVKAIYQSFDKKDLYPSVEEKAANLLYFIIKNHSFVDGNKRIAAAIFLWFLSMNEILYSPEGNKRIANNALVALCLMIAESNPAEKDMIIKVVVNLINREN